MHPARGRALMSGFTIHAEEESAFATLGVERDATQADLKRAYLLRVMETHPDRGGDSDKFRYARAWGVRVGAGCERSVRTVARCFRLLPRRKVQTAFKLLADETGGSAKEARAPATPGCPVSGLHVSLPRASLTMHPPVRVLTSPWPRPLAAARPPSDQR